MTGPPQTQPRLYQEDELPRGKLMAIVLATFLLSAGLCVGGWGILRARRSEIRPPEEPPIPLPDRARERAGVEEGSFSLTSEGQLLQAAQRRSLQHWAWADRQRGIVRVPIDEAMRLVAERERKPRP